MPRPKAITIKPKKKKKMRTGNLQMNMMHKNLRHPKVQPASDLSIELSNRMATVLLQIQRTSMTNIEMPPMIKLISLTHPGQANKTKLVISFIGEGEGKGKVAALTLFLAQTSVSTLLGLPQWHPRPTEPGLRLWRCKYVTTLFLTTIPSSEHAHQQKAYHDCSSAFVHQSICTNASTHQKT